MDEACLKLSVPLRGKDEQGMCRETEVPELGLRVVQGQKAIQPLFRAERTDAPQSARPNTLLAAQP